MITLTVIIAAIAEMCKRCKVDSIVRPGPEAEYPNSYFITLIVLQHLFGFSSESSFLRFLVKLQHPGLTNVPERSWYNRKAKKLVNQVEGVRLLMLHRLGASDIKIRIIDSVPVPVITYVRASRCHSFTNQATAGFGYCAATKTKYFGQKLTLLATPQGLPTDYRLSLANRHDVRVFKEFLSERGYNDMTFIGDKGYLMRESDQTALLAVDHNRLVTPFKSNQAKRNTPVERRLLKKRKIIETVNSQLADQMELKRTRAKSDIGLKTRIAGIIASFTFGMYFNYRHHRNILSVKSLLI